MAISWATTLIAIGGWGQGANAITSPGTLLLSVVGAFAITLWCMWEGQQHSQAVHQQHAADLAAAQPFGRIQ